MPFGDGTGPIGEGPISGWGRGFCCANFRRGYAFRSAQKSYFGFGRGWRNWYRLTGLTGWQRALCNPYNMSEFPKEAQKELLKKEAEYLEEELKTVKEHLNNLDKDVQEK